jgi:uroporphyrinogen-III synthase
MSNSVFISRTLDEDSDLIRSLHHHGYLVTAISMIRTEPIAFNPDIPFTDWIFFSSSRAVQNFFLNEPQIGGQKFAALGEGTAEELKKFREPDYTGHASDPADTAKEFAAMVSASTVLFPVAEQSLCTIQNALAASQVTNVVCYRSIPAPVDIGFPDVLVFSSPSNVHSFYKLNRILTYQKVIAYGKATAAALTSFYVDDIIIPRSLKNEDLVKAIIG